MLRQNKSPHELGRRLVKGPRLAVNYCQAASEKYATGNRPPQSKNKSKKKPRSINLLQLNINGIKHKKTEIAHIAKLHQVHVVLLQETLHNETSNLKITGYTEYQCKCDGCRGIITYIRNDITADVENIPFQETDIQKVSVWFDNQKFTVYNVYSPPSSTCCIQDLNGNSFNKTILAGDFNGHSPLWGYSGYNSTGKYIEDLNETTNLIIKQTDKSTPTLLHRAHNTLHRPDLTLVSSDLDHLCQSTVLPDAGSDHKPILTTLTLQKKSTDKVDMSRWNFKKANWSSFKDMTETNFSIDDDTDINEMEEHLTKTILEAAKIHIPRGKQPNYKPFWNKTIEEAVKARQEARVKFEETKSSGDKIEYNRLTALAKRKIILAKREKWRDTCSKLDLKNEGAKAWKLLNNLSGNNKRTNPSPLEGGETPTKKAELFTKTFANINKSTTDEEDHKLLMKELKMRERTDNERIPELFMINFSMEELEQAIYEAKPKKSPGPDKIHNEMLKNLGAQGKTKLLKLINKTWSDGKLPNKWKNAFIIPILKKSKDPKDPKSYRPISLTSCIGKLAEKMINKRLYWWLETNEILCEEQAGFRKSSRTEDQLFTLCQHIQDGFQAGAHTTSVFVDLQQAYDRVWRKGLLLKMRRIGIKGNMYKWVKNYLCERTIQTKLENTTSSKRTLEEGIPQGSSLSCTLFLIFINDMVKEINSDKALYADDLVLWKSHRYARQSARYLNQDLRQLSEYCRKWKIKINASKTVYNIFTLSPKVNKQQLDIRIADTQIKKELSPSYLGVQLDTRLTLRNHAMNIKQKATKRLNLLKRLSSTSWGSNMDTLRNLYIGYIRSILDYNASLQVICSKTTQQELDRVQSNSLRFICGGMRTTPASACEIHSNVDPLSLRRDKAALQMVERLSRMNDNHPGKQTIERWIPKERIKQKSFLHHTRDLQEECHLPKEREPIRRICKEIPPHFHLYQPIYETTLKDKSVNKTSDPILLKLSAENTIDSYPLDWIHVYTDGSAFKATVNAGYGVRICFPDGKAHNIAEACGSNCSNFDAEILAINAACTFLNTEFQKHPSKITNIVIFSDSQSALEAMKNKQTENKTILSLLFIINKIQKTFSQKIFLQWIPGHIGIPGNEIADKLAKKGTTLQQPTIETPYQTAKHTIDNNFKEKWLNMWALGNTGRCVFQNLPKPNSKDEMKLLNRNEQTIIFRLRTQHVTLNQHLNRIGLQQTPLCPLCNTFPESTRHTLFECNNLQDLRKELLPPNPNISNTLYCEAAQLKKTSIYFNMALGRRMKVQRPLD